MNSLSLPLVQKSSVRSKIAGALSYNGSSDYTSLPGSSSLNLGGNVTIEAWIKSSSNATEESIFGGYNASSPYAGYGFEIYSGALRFWSSAVGSWSTSTSSTYANGSWHHVVVVDNGSTATFYKDGSPDGSSSSQNPGAYTGSKAMAARSDAAQKYSGTLEEVRISSTARSSDWISTEYNNQSSPSTFYSVGSATTSGGGSSPSITNLSPSSGAVGTSVTITGSNFGSSQGSSTVTFNGTAATPTSWSATSIVATVPSGATTGNVVVTVGGIAGNGVSFTVEPDITSLSSTTGGVEQIVYVAGYNFGVNQGRMAVEPFQSTRPHGARL